MWSRRRESRQGRLSISADSRLRAITVNFSRPWRDLCARLSYPAVPAGLFSFAPSGAENSLILHMWYTRSRDSFASAQDTLFDSAPVSCFEEKRLVALRSG